MHYRRSDVLDKLYPQGKGSCVKTECIVTGSRIMIDWLNKEYKEEQRWKDLSMVPVKQRLSLALRKEQVAIFS